MKRVLRISSLVVFVFALLALVACAPKNSEKAVQKMKDAGYTVAGGAYSEEKEDGSIASITATNLNNITGDSMTAVLYKTKKQAKAAFNDSKDAEGKSNFQLVGKWVVWGTESAVKAFKK